MLAGACNRFCKQAAICFAQPHFPNVSFHFGVSLHSYCVDGRFQVTKSHHGVPCRMPIVHPDFKTGRLGLRNEPFRSPERFVLESKTTWPAFQCGLACRHDSATSVFYALRYVSVWLPLNIESDLACRQLMPANGCLRTRFGQRDKGGMAARVRPLGVSYSLANSWAETLIES